MKCFFSFQSFYKVQVFPIHFDVKKFHFHMSKFDFLSKWSLISYYRMHEWNIPRASFAPWTWFRCQKLPGSFGGMWLLYNILAFYIYSYISFKSYFNNHVSLLFFHMLLSLVSVICYVSLRLISPLTHLSYLSFFSLSAILYLSVF